MAAPLGLSIPPRESFLLEQVSESSTSGFSNSYRGDYSSNTEDEEFPQFEELPHFPHVASDYLEERTRRTMIGRILYALGMDVRQQTGAGKLPIDYEYFSPTAARDELPDGLLSRKRAPRDRTRRRTKFWTVIKRGLVVVPVGLLLLFGVVHLVQAAFGSEYFGRDADDYDEKFLPKWGAAGHFGEGLADYPTDATRDVTPIPCHSHNDYWRRVPFWDAIHWGCTSVEADVWFFDDELFVGHNVGSLTRNRTFQSLYVNPITQLLDRMNPTTEFSNTTGHGVFDEDPQQTLVLLVDFKTPGPETFQAVSDHLRALREKNYLSYWDGTTFHSRAVTIVATGNAPFELITASPTHRDIFYDAPLDRLYEPAPETPSPTSRLTRRSSPSPDSLLPAPSAFDPSNSYYASTSFTRTIGFLWRGRLTPSQIETLRGQIRGARRRGLKARYWDTPSWPRGLRDHVWGVLVREGAEVLNVDDLPGAARASWRRRRGGGGGGKGVFVRGDAGFS